MKSTWLIVAFSLSLGSQTTQAQPPQKCSERSPRPSVESDPDMKGATEICERCHNDSPRSAAPNLTNQDADYLVNELTEFKNRCRTTGPAMNWITQAIKDDKQMCELARWGRDESKFFSPDPACSSRQPPARLQQCASCHGDDGIPRTKNAYPRLKFQRFAYLKRQLENFRSAKRIDSVMNAIASDLTDDDIVLLAQWFCNPPTGDKHAHE